MELPQTKITWKTAWFPLIGVAAFLLYIYLFNVDIQSIINTLKTIDILPYMLAAALSLVEILFFAVSWRALLNFLSIKISVFRSYLFVWYGIFVDTLVPAESVSGELLRVYLVTKEKGNDKCGATMASLMAHRLLGMSMNVAVLVLGVVLLVTQTQIQLSSLVFNSILLVTVAIAATLIVLMTLSFKEKWTLKVIHWAVNLTKKISFGKWKLNSIKENAIQISKSFHDSMKEFKNKPEALTISLFYLAITWFISLSIQYLVFFSLRVPVSWSMITITSAVVLAVKSIPAGIPFEVGIPEAAMTTLYVAFNVPAEIAATATILSRVLTLWLRFVIGFFSQQWLTFRPVINSGSKETGVLCKT
jgi:uncharacterized protein (TIRG00374 family)